MDGKDPGPSRRAVSERITTWSSLMLDPHVDPAYSLPFFHAPGSDAMAGSTDPVEVLGVFAQKSNPANVVILGAGAFIW